MTVWLVAATVLATTVLVCCQLRVRHYSGTHLVAHLSVLGRGLYFSRTADGGWAKLLVRERRRCGWPGEAGDSPPDIGVREPRRPLDRGPGAGAAELSPPDA